MIDYHVHIGQYKNFYFYPDRVFFALKENGISQCWFSSTTSCLYCKESNAAKNDNAIFKNAPTARELFDCLLEEMKSSLECANILKINAHPLYWVVPDIHKTGITLEEALNNIRFEGFKIHPRAQFWDLNNPQDFELAEKIFNLAEKRKLSVVIHTGLKNGIDEPRKFERIIKEHPNCRVQLCHIKDADECLYMLDNYPNVMVDTAFSSEDEIKKVLNSGEFKNRILWGTDFPITFWYSEKDLLKEDPDKEKLRLFYQSNVLL